MEKFKWGVFAAAMALAAVMILHPAGWTHAQYTPPSGGGGGGTCGGDVTGPCSANTVVKLQNRALSATAPSDTNTICWDDGGSTWKPCAGGAGSTTSQGTFASLPGTCNAGDLYFPTNTPINPMRCTGSNIFSSFVSGMGGAVTLPVLANFTVVNAGTSTTDTTHGGIRLSTVAGDNAFNFHGLMKSAPATPYHVIACLYPAPASGSNAQIGLAFRNSVSGKLEQWGTFQNTTNQYVAFYLSDNTTFGGTPVNTNSSVWSATLCLRIGDDATNRTFDISVDGRVTWVNLGSEGRTVNFTADQVGLFNDGPLQTGFFLDYEETP